MPGVSAGECLFVFGPGFDSKSPTFARIRVRQAAESDGRLAQKRNRTPICIWGKGLCRHNLCRCLQHSNLVQVVSFWNVLL